MPSFFKISSRGEEGNTFSRSFEEFEGQPKRNFQLEERAANEEGHEIICSKIEDEKASFTNMGKSSSVSVTPLSDSDSNGVRIVKENEGDAIDDSLSEEDSAHEESREIQDKGEII